MQVTHKGFLSLIQYRVLTLLCCRHLWGVLLTNTEVNSSIGDYTYLWNLSATAFSLGKSKAFRVYTFIWLELLMRVFLLADMLLLSKLLRFGLVSLPIDWLFLAFIDYNKLLTTINLIIIVINNNQQSDSKENSLVSDGQVMGFVLILSNLVLHYFKGSSRIFNCSFWRR